jgi:hypothetical protein
VTYTLHVRTADGCVATLDTTVVAKQLSAPTLTLTGSICTAITLKATPGLGGTGIEWTDDNYNRNPTSSVRLVVMADDITSSTYTVVSTNTDGCPSEVAEREVKQTKPDAQTKFGKIGLKFGDGTTPMKCTTTTKAGKITIDK